MLSSIQDICVLTVIPYTVTDHILVNLSFYKSFFCQKLEISVSNYMLMIKVWHAIDSENKKCTNYSDLTIVI